MYFILLNEGKFFLGIWFVNFLNFGIINVMFRLEKFIIMFLNI